MRSGSRLHLFILFSLLGAFLGSCTQCGGVPSKAEYIQILDARCEALKTKAEGKTAEFKELASKDLNAFISQFEKFVSEVKQEDEALQAVKRPNEDSELLTKFWAEDMKIYELTKPYIQQLKSLGELVSDLRERATKGETSDELGSRLMAGQKDVMKTISQLNAQMKIISELARKYGFKVCGTMETGFSGQMQ